MVSFFRKIPRTIIVLIVLATFGLVRTPFENRLGEQLIEAKLVVTPPGMTVLDQMGQSALMATLGGLRPLVAGFLSLRGYENFSEKNWDELRQTYLIITALEPLEESHWVNAIWHLGINATANMELDTKLPGFERKRRFHNYAQQAIEFAEKGLEQVPDSVPIRKQLAEVYREKLKDWENAAKVYGEMMQFDDAPQYAERFHGYFLAKVPGKEQEAYNYLKGLYDEGEHQHLPTLIFEIRRLEEELKIPYPERIPDDGPDANFSRPQKPSPPVLPGGIVIP